MLLCQRGLSATDSNALDLARALAHRCQRTSVEQDLPFK